MSNTKNQITFDGGAVVFTRPDGGVYTVPASAVYVVYHDDTATFKLVALPRESGLAIMSVRASDVEVDGQSYSSIDDLKAALDDKFAKAAGGGGVSFEVVEELPTSGETNIIYLVPSPDTQGTYDEYIWLEEEEQWELLGSTQIDLSGYVTEEEFSGYSATTEAAFSAHTADTSIHVTTALTTEIQTISGKVDTNEQITAAALNELNSRFGIIATELDDKQDVLTAGEGISISGNVISATGGGSGESDVYLVDFWGIFDGNVDMDETLWQEIADAFNDGKAFISKSDDQIIPLSVFYTDNELQLFMESQGQLTWLDIMQVEDSFEVITHIDEIVAFRIPFNEWYNSPEAQVDDEIWNSMLSNEALGTPFYAADGYADGELLAPLSYKHYFDEDDEYIELVKLDETGWQKIEIQRVSVEGEDPEFIITPSSGSTGGASQAALDELSGQVQTIDTVVATALNELNNEVSGATGAVSTLSGTVTGLSQSVNSLSNRVSNVEQNKPDVFLVPFKDLFDDTSAFDYGWWEDIINAYDNHSVIMTEPMAGVDTEYQIISVDHPTATQLILRLAATNDEIVIDWNEGEDPEFDVATYKGARMRQISQADYNALVTKDPNTLYIINDNV